MIKNNFYPLRTIVGSSISLRGILPFPSVAPPMQIVVRNHPDIYNAVNDEVYSKYLPDIIKDGVTYHPVQGMNTMPVPESNLVPFSDFMPQGLRNLFKNPSDLPFSETDKVASIYGYQEHSFVEQQLRHNIDESDPNHFYSGRDRDYSFLVLLEKEALIGGICFNGYPYITSRIEKTEEGMTVGNFGLPREIRLTPLPTAAIISLDSIDSYQFLDSEIGFRSQYIDAEFAYSRQDIVSHSGLNYLTIDPVKTNLFLLTITDLPFIPKIIDLDVRKDDPDNPLLVQGFKGFAIPYLYFFEYKEQTKSFARLHSGLLGVKPTYPHLPKKDGHRNSHDVLRRAFPEYEFYFGEQKKKADTNATDKRKIKAIEAELSKLKTKLKKQGLKESKETKEQIGKLEKELAKLKTKIKGDKNDNKQERKYISYTAHSALGQRREFKVSYAELQYPPNLVNQPSFYRNTKFLPECFISDLLQPDESVILYLHQGEEFERCVAGLKALFIMLPPDKATEWLAEIIANVAGVGTPDNQLSDAERTFIEDTIAVKLRLPIETNFCEKIGLKIFEIDPPEGLSPASIELNDKTKPTYKYATLLADVIIDDFKEVVLSQFLKGIPFRKTSSSRYFAIELTNKGDKNGQVAIHSLHLVRSAHVSVQPRPAKTQQVKAMHYRIIGPELADDFSKLGNEGFNFSIDKVTAGQTKNVLYSAMSLLDLLHTGGARIHSNVRRRAVEFEMVENFREQAKNDNYSIKKFTSDNFTRLNEDNRTSIGWRRNETGDGVTWSYRNNRPQDFPSSLNESAFENYGTIENRIHNSLLFPDTTNVDWATISALGNMLKVITDPTQGLQTIIRQLSDQSNGGGMNNLRRFIDSIVPDGLLIKSYRANAVANNDTEQLVKGFERIWRGISTSANNLRVAGIISSSQSPVGISAIAGNLLGDVIESLDNLMAVGNDLNSVLTEGKIEKMGEVLEGLGGIIDLLITMGTIATSVLPGSPTAGAQVIPFLNGLTLGLTSGVGVNVSSGPNLILPSFQMTANSGSTGSINKSATKTGYSYSQLLNVGHDNSILGDNEIKRIVTRRELLNRDNERVRGAEVMWQHKIQDIITGSIPLNFTLPATATKMNFRTADESLRVRFNSGFSPSIQVDFWFEITEETIKDDN